MKKLLLPLFIVLIFTAFRSINVTLKTITGIVTDQNNRIPLQGVSVTTLPGKAHTITDKNGKYSIRVEDKDVLLKFSLIGYSTKTVKVRHTVNLNITLTKNSSALKEIAITESAERGKKTTGSDPVTDIAQGTATGNLQMEEKSIAAPMIMRIAPMPQAYPMENTESYAAINENSFRTTVNDPLSTFSIDVDAAAYANVRRYINNGGLPPADAVRIEEMINYFDYEYPQPKGNDPVNIITEISNAPWNTSHKLVQIGLQGKKIATDNLPASNLVFLIDVSGSMNSANKLPLLVSSLKLLTDQLRPSDKVAIVVYAGNSGLVLPSTPGNQKSRIKDALNQLSAGGSTAGGQGLKLAYKVATENFIKNGNNRIILATDGDFNVGISSDAEMQRLVEAKRKSGVFLTVLGYGMGNYKDSKMETLADKGNGNYAYIDNISEARKVLVNEFGGTLFTIAKDVKLQIEFNPAKVQAYRLIGYENRMLKNEEFNDDKKDAGELGAGHTVTALYEIIPAGIKSNFTGSVDKLKYQKQNKPAAATKSNEMLTVKLRYKAPGGNVSRLLEKPVTDEMVPFKSTSNNFRFAAAVAEFGMLLRGSEFRQNSSFNHLIATAKNALGQDKEGYRAEFLKLAKSTQLIAKDLLSLENKTALNEKN